MSLMKRASQIRFQQLARNDGNPGEILCSSEMPRIVMFQHFLILLSETFSSEVKVKCWNEGRCSQIFKRYCIAEERLPGTVWLWRNWSITAHSNSHRLRDDNWEDSVGCVLDVLKELFWSVPWENKNERDRKIYTYIYILYIYRSRFLLNHFYHFQSIRPDVSCFDLFGREISNQTFPSQSDNTLKLRNFRHKRQAKLPMCPYSFPVVLHRLFLFVFHIASGVSGTPCCYLVAWDEHEPCTPLSVEDVQL